jgi:hypothetical protein
MQDAIANMRACAAEQDDARRLSCYDKQFRQSAVSSGRADSAVAPDALSAEERFGLTAQLERKEHGGAAQPPQLDKLSSRIAAVTYKIRGEAVITLDNGQVWEQAEVQSRVPLKPGDLISIRRGALGSFWLSTPVSGFRARRVR